MKDSIQELLDVHIEIENLKTQFSTDLKKIDPNIEEDDSLCKYLLHRLRDTREELVEKYSEILEIVDSIRSQLRCEQELAVGEDLR